MGKQQDPNWQNKSRAEQPYRCCVASEDKCKSEKTKAVLQISDMPLKGSCRVLENISSVENFFFRKKKKMAEDTTFL